jgi:hypothetical protein
MLSCKQASHLLSQSMERRLPLRQQFGLRLHLMMCDACTQFSRQLGMLRTAVTQLGHKIENDDSLGLSKNAHDRIAHKLASQAHQLDAARRNPDQNFTD